MNKAIFIKKVRMFRFWFKNSFLSFPNLVVFVIVFIAVSFTWMTTLAMHKNYEIVKELESKKRERQIAEIQHDTLKFEQNYLRSEEFQEISAREKLGLVKDGENVLMLPAYPKEESPNNDKHQVRQSNFSEWMNFLFGGNVRKNTR